MMVVGPTGAGKSVLLSLIALQFRRYARAQVYIFDKGNSARAAVLTMGGAHHALGSAQAGGEAMAFQPLAGIDDAAERSGAAECGRQSGVEGKSGPGRVDLGVGRTFKKKKHNYQ